MTQAESYEQLRAMLMSQAEMGRSMTAQGRAMTLHAESILRSLFAAADEAPAPSPPRTFGND